MTTTVTKVIRISAAHHIPNHPGKCRRPHGHNYTIEATVRGEVLPETGMVIDFYEMGQQMQQVVGRFDHQDLNEMLPRTITTAENLAHYWLKHLQTFDTRYVKVRVYETEDCYADAFGSE